MDFVLNKHQFSYDCIHSLMEENPRGGYSFVVPTALMLNKEEQLILLLANGLWDVWIQVLDPVTGSVIQQVRHNDPNFSESGEEIIETEEGYVLVGRKQAPGYHRLFAWKLDKDFNILKAVSYTHLTLPTTPYV